MANTTSLSFPNMFNVSQNCVSVLEGSKSVVNRTKLLILTEPTEVYNEPNQGVGLHRHMWKYNNENEKTIIVDRIKEQLSLHEPYAVAEDTQYADGNLFTGGHDDDNTYANVNELQMTIAITTTFSEKATVRIGQEDVSIY